MNVVRVKVGVVFSIIAPAGFRILSAIDKCTVVVNRDLVITSACDGVHSGPGDPHHTGEAYDVRTHDFPDEPTKQLVLKVIMETLGWDHFYGFIEASGTDNEHIHVQRKKGMTYP